MAVIITGEIFLYGEKLYSVKKCICNIVCWPNLAGYCGVQEEGSSAGQAIPAPRLNTPALVI